MAPIRRYLRITKYSVLEVRIYLDKPSDTSWLLSSRDNVLQRILQEVRPKVLPKLREENENAKKKGGKGKKKRGIKDVASQEDFEVTIFLTETSTRHSLCTKRKVFEDKPRIKSTGGKLTGWLGGSEGKSIVIEDDEKVPQVLREEDDVVELADIPEVGGGGKRKAFGVTDEGDDALFVSSSDEETFQTQRERGSKRTKRSADRANATEPLVTEDVDMDDKKKLAMNTSYDGFSIYGRILCLVVKRKGKKAAQVPGAPAGGSQMMEHWVSTQAAQEVGLDDDEDG